MTNTERTLAFRKEEESVGIAAEAGGIRAIMDLIYYHWDDIQPQEEARRELQCALYGLKTLIEAHAEHAEQLCEAHPHE